MKRRDVEILAPAGSLDSLYSSLRMGADAVYVGLPRFGARAFADNPDVEQLREALYDAHLRGKKIYLTTNTLLRDDELPALCDMIAPLYEAGLDACIVQDIGVLSLLHKNFPDMDLHASTQMTLFSGEEAELYRAFGVTRYVPARELSIEEIREARRQTDMEIEVFVHGALCYSYSGQCLMSEVIGGRSGNRGMCAQPCRLPFTCRYGRGHFLSTKDICTLPYIPELVDAGIDSFKIEGRMKSREYSAFLAYLYRFYVDFYLEEGREAFAALVGNEDSRFWKDYKRCLELYNRGGFSNSFLFEKKKEEMMEIRRNGHAGLLVGTVREVGKGLVSFDTLEELQYQDVLEFRNEDGTREYEYTVKNPAQKGERVCAKFKRGCHLYCGQPVYRMKNTALLTEIRKRIAEAEDKLPLSATWMAEQGKPIAFSVTGQGVTVTIHGAVLQKAQKQPLTNADVRRRLDAMGNEKYVWETLTIQQAPDSFVPLGEIKRLRREGIAAWERAAVTTRKAGKIMLEPDRIKTPSVKQYAAVIGVSDERQLRLALETDAENCLIHLRLGDVNDWRPDSLGKLLNGREAAISLPRILRGAGYRKWMKKWNEQEKDWQQIAVSAVFINSHRSLLFAREYYPQAAYYADDNMYQENEWAKAAYERMGLRACIPQTYGRLAVMVTAGCVKATVGRCDGRQETVEMKNPKMDTFAVVCHCDTCYNTIYTKEPVRLENNGSTLRLEFTWESEDEMRKVMGEWNLL